MYRLFLTILLLVTMSNVFSQSNPYDIKCVKGKEEPSYARSENNTSEFFWCGVSKPTTYTRCQCSRERRIKAYKEHIKSVDARISEMSRRNQVFLDKSDKSRMEAEAIVRTLDDQTEAKFGLEKSKAIRLYKRAIEYQESRWINRSLCNEYRNLTSRESPNCPNEIPYKARNIESLKSAITSLKERERKVTYEISVSNGSGRLSDGYSKSQGKQDTGKQQHEDLKKNVSSKDEEKKEKKATVYWTPEMTKTLYLNKRDYLRATNQTHTEEYRETLKMIQWQESLIIEKKYPVIYSGTSTTNNSADVYMQNRERQVAADKKIAATNALISEGVNFITNIIEQRQETNRLAELKREKQAEKWRIENAKKQEFKKKVKELESPIVSEMERRTKLFKSHQKQIKAIEGEQLEPVYFYVLYTDFNYNKYENNCDYDDNQIEFEFLENPTLHLSSLIEVYPNVDGTFPSPNVVKEMVTKKLRSKVGNKNFRLFDWKQSSKQATQDVEANAKKLAKLYGFSPQIEVGQYEIIQLNMSSVTSKVNYWKEAFLTDDVIVED